MPGLGRGERTSDFVLPLEDGTPTRFYAKAGGRSTVLIFGAAEPVGKLLHFAAALYASVSGDVSIFAVKRTGQQADLQAAPGDKFAIPVFSDVEGNRARSSCPSFRIIKSTTAFSSGRLA